MSHSLCCLEPSNVQFEPSQGGRPRHVSSIFPMQALEALLVHVQVGGGGAAVKPGACQISLGSSSSVRFEIDSMSAINSTTKLIGPGPQ